MKGREMSAPHYADEAVTLHHGDALKVLRTLPNASVDAVVTDPPYGLEFMGKDWDSFKPSAARLRTRVDGRTNPAEGKSVTTTPEAYVAGAPFQRWCEAWAAECLRVLKPGGHLLAFGGTRTAHRLTAGIEDAGFEIRDGIDWLYASGFPKSLDVSKAIDKAAGAQREVIGTRPQLPDGTRGARARPNASPEVYGDRVGLPGEVPVTAPATEDAARWSGWGTALKPAREPIVMARKPLVGTVAANVQQYGTGALNIDACRVPSGGEHKRPGVIVKRTQVSGDDRTTAGAGRYAAGASFEATNHDGGRWPANVVLSHAPDCGEVCLPGCPVAELDAQSGYSKSPPVGSVAVKVPRVGQVAKGDEAARVSPNGHGDAGGASRFFPVFRYEAKAPTAERPRTADGVAHPTVKPLDLMRWPARLVTPSGGTVLEPFAGSGTTAEACVLEGFRCIAIERDETYLPLITARLAKPLQPALDLFGDAA